MITLPQYDAFIFDMDGVLVDSEPFHAETEQRCFKELGLNISEEEHATYLGTASAEMWETIKSQYNLPQTVDELVEMNTNLTIPAFQNLIKMDLIPGVLALINKLKMKGIPLALASSSTYEVIEIILDKTGSRDYFDVVVDGRMVAQSKPEPEIFLLTAKKLGVQPSKCIVIEDSRNGITAAKAAGMFCIAYDDPGAMHQDQSHADIIINDFQTLIDSL